MSPSVSVGLLLTQSDARLVRLAREGHERAFEALVQRYRRPLLAYCRRVLLPNERAEDALQQGLLHAWLALQNGAEVRDAKPWLYRIVHNAALNALRVSGYDYATLNDTLSGSDAPEQDLDRRIAVREALAGLAALPDMQREALLRTAVDGHSHEHVARALGLSEGALRGLVYRARATLRAATTALTPSPIVNWAVSARVSASAPLLARAGEAGAGGGSLGVGGLLLKGGALAMTAGALAGGVAVVHRTLHIAIPAGSPPGDTQHEPLAAGPRALAGEPGDERRPDGSATAQRSDASLPSLQSDRARGGGPPRNKLFVLNDHGAAPALPGLAIHAKGLAPSGHGDEPVRELSSDGVGRESGGHGGSGTGSTSGSSAPSTTNPSGDGGSKSGSSDNGSSSGQSGSSLESNSLSSESGDFSSNDSTGSSGGSTTPSDGSSTTTSDGSSTTPSDTQTTSSPDGSLTSSSGSSGSSDSSAG